MVIVTSPEKPFVFSAKGGIKRKAAEAEYADEISSLYFAVGQCIVREDPSYPFTWDLDSVSRYVRTIIERTLFNSDVNLSDDDDIFNNGCDR